ncbi:sporulation peptidase YabG [Chengkuizengella axinellae]|uniref:Sporulation peptidase YabG n=1 Tax=Chengkuizengella axinellae TaxID=3064388 RepID=A0ABT9J5P2_9BACL|nr:sporulation peptidase YabG [Chengkuizengella sp. 2205SS18-9]MDP5276938.1 sporulation peptidase YabG [Chengkuizengella sp. 2205SS18-9]
MYRGDLVTRRSYGEDVVFEILDINRQLAFLRGVEYRLFADSPMHDLNKVHDYRLTKDYMRSHSRVQQTHRLIQQYRREQQETNLQNMIVINEQDEEQELQSYFEVPGKVLHLDGDSRYLNKSLDLYNQLRVPVEGHYIQEKDMPDQLYDLLPKAKPDVLVITGHDSLIKNRRNRDEYSLDSYKNSRNFAKAVKIAREYEKNKDTLMIVAGACQSHFEALLQAGANFASSPQRILIHALDPVQIASKISYTSIKETVNMSDVISYTISGIKGMGGIESRGSYRIGLPNIKKSENNH